MWVLSISIYYIEIKTETFFFFFFFLAAFGLLLCAGFL